MKRGNLVFSVLTALFLVFSFVAPSFAASTPKVIKKVTATKDVCVHSNAGAKYKKIGVAKKGKELQVVSTTKNKTWYKIIWNSHYGYVYANYTKAVVANTTASKPVTTKPVASKPVAVKPKLESSFILATTTSTQDSGLLDAIIPVFEAKYDVDVKVVAVGTGQAIKMGEQGDADVLMVHDRKSEDKFVAEGRGTYAWNLMYNQFLIAGPKDDPAHIKDSKTVQDAFKKIADTKSIFISRADKSGTNAKELTLWSDANITPSGDWYKKAGLGMGDTLRMADELGGYTLSDEATFLTNKTSLVCLLKGQKELLNPYGIIEVVGTDKPNVSKTFIDWLVSPEGQKLIGKYGKTKYGKPLFVPNASKR
ncbi:MAG: substrate-binding domain-containing protein [Bacillota bacterium]|nr:substrate-binding domain-containing protein [Bacillota bacterium]